MPEQSVLDEVFEALRDLLVQAPADGSLGDWPDGPEGVLRSRDTGIDAYIDCIRELEAGPLGAQGIGVIAQRMRRLYFSVYTMKVANGKLFVSLLLDFLGSPLMPLSEPPLTTAHVSQQALTTLYATSAATTLTTKIGISHLWTSLDLALNGINPAAATAQGLILKSRIPVLATWLGDLASAVLKFEGKLSKLPSGDGAQARQARLVAMAESVNEKAGIGDMLGNLDGIALGRHLARSPQNFTLSEVLQEYYDNEALAPGLAANLGRPSAAHRFHYFLKYVDPQLPATGLDTSPLRATFDKVTARNAMPQLLSNAIDDMFQVARVRALGIDPIKFVFQDRGALQSISERLDRHQARHAFHWLCDDFCRFIDDGIRFGTASWPSDP